MMSIRHDGISSRDARAWALPALAPLLLAALLLALPHGAAAAAEPAGRLISSVGDVRAIDANGVERRLARGDEVYARDTLTVGARASAQLRMRDQAMIDLDAQSRFAIERYDYDDGGEGGGSAVMRFLRGAVRTVTGLVGKNPDDTYRMKTPVATIGVRGTQYALQLCDVRCAGEGRPPGLYGRVDEGAISVSNRAASVEFTKNEYFHVADRDVVPREIVRPPEGILDGGAVASGDLEGLDGDLALAADLLDVGGGLLDTGGALVDTTLMDTLDTTESLLDTGGGLVDDTVTTVEEDSGNLLEGTVDEGGNLIEDTLGL